MSEAQVLAEIHRLAVASQAANPETPPDWPRIKRTVLRSRPPCGGIVDDLCFFVLKRSGGVDGEDMQDWVRFYNRYCGTVRLPGDVYTAAGR